MSSSDSISKRLISGGFFAISGKIILAISALLINALITRLLPPESVGVYYILASIVAVGAVTVQFGAHQAIVKLIAGNRASQGEASIRSSIKATFLIVFSGIFIFGFVYLCGFGDWVSANLFEVPLSSGITYLTVSWVSLLALQILFSQIFRGFHQIAYAAVFEGVSTSVFMAFALVFIWFFRGSSGVEEVLWLTNIALIFSLIIAVFLFKQFYFSTPVVKGVNLSGVMYIGGPLFVASITMPGFTESHVWLLSAYSDENAVAIYGAAFRLAKFVVIPLLVVNSVIPPMIAKLLAEQKNRDVERVLRATAAIAGLPSIMIVIMLAFLGESILSLLFGDFYKQGANVLLILAGGQAINALTGSPGVLLMMSGHQAIFMKFAVVSGLFGVMTSYFLVQLFGYTGVAVGVSVGLVMHNVAMWLYCHYQLGISTHMGLDSIHDITDVIKKRILSSRES